jgi:hypothetical protein
MLFSLYTGLVATTVMTVFLWVLKYFSLINISMLKALGSVLTKNDKNALIPGIIINYLAGITFCFFYILLFKIFPLAGTGEALILLGSAMGFAHGVVVALLLVVLVAEHHPLEKYKSVGFKVAGYYLISHIIYGFTIGLLYFLTLN